MCFAFDAHPPDLPADLALPTLAGGAAAEALELTSADGTRFSAALAESPEATGGPGRRDPARRPRPVPLLRRAGRALRAGRPSRHRHRLLRPHRRARASAATTGTTCPTSMQTRVEQVQADAAAAIARPARAHGRELDRHRRLLLRRHAVVPGRDERRARPRRRRRLLRQSRPAPRGRPGPDRARAARPAARCSGSSAGPTSTSCPSTSRPTSAGCEEAGVEHEIVTYPGAPHSFFDRSFSEHAEACEDAWRRVLGFLQQVGASLAR